MPPAALKTLCLPVSHRLFVRLSPLPSTDSNMRLSVFISLFTCCGSFAFRTNIPLLSSTSAFSRYASRCSASSSSSNNPATSASSFHDHFEKGRRAEKKGKLASAREHFLRALIHKWAVQKEFVGAVEFRLASVQAERGDAEEAVDLYRLSMDHWPELATCCDAQNCLGLALEEAGCTGDALQAYSAAISCEPWRPEVRKREGSSSHIRVHKSTAQMQPLVGPDILIDLICLPDDFFFFQTTAAWEPGQCAMGTRRNRSSRKGA